MVKNWRVFSSSNVLEIKEKTVLTRPPIIAAKIRELARKGKLTEEDFEALKKDKPFFTPKFWEEIKELMKKVCL
jgi:hypothetical protein